MLPVYIVSRYNIRPSSGVLFQWLNVSMRLYSSSDSSSDSSDSDSDTEKVKQRKPAKSTDSATPDSKANLGSFLNNMMKQRKPSVKSTDSATPDSKANLGSFLNNMIKEETFKTTEDIPAISSTKVESKTTAAGSIDLNEFVNNMLKARKLEKTFDVAIQPRKSAPKKNKPISYEKQLVKAAENVADKLGGDKTKTVSDLLSKVQSYKDEVEKKDKKLAKNAEYKAEKSDKQKKDEQLKKITKSDADVIEYIKSKRFGQSKEEDRKQESFMDKKQESFTDKKQENFMEERRSEKKSVIQNLLEDYKKQAETASISQQLLQSTETTMQQKSNLRKPFPRQSIDIWNGTCSQAFEEMGDVSPYTPELKIWAALEQRELKALTTYPPANIFQEMVLWTEQGKLWKFPIDNEQGMEEEHSIHFSKHVFTERYLKGWCPKSGPIRHFMELVCVGLSKNPYMTVQEKINHIMWYRDYFKSKEELLQELGTISEPFPDTTKQITQ